MLTHTDSFTDKSALITVVRLCMIAMRNYHDVYWTLCRFANISIFGSSIMVNYCWIQKLMNDRQIDQVVRDIKHRAENTKSWGHRTSKVESRLCSKSVAGVKTLEKIEMEGK